MADLQQALLDQLPYLYSRNPFWPCCQFVTYDVRDALSLPPGVVDGPENADRLYKMANGWPVEDEHGGPLVARSPWSTLRAWFLAGVADRPTRVPSGTLPELLVQEVYAVQTWWTLGEHPSGRRFVRLPGDPSKPEGDLGHNALFVQVTAERGYALESSLSQGLRVNGTPDPTQWPKEAIRADTPWVDRLPTFADWVNAYGFRHVQVARLHRL